MSAFGQDIGRLYFANKPVNRHAPGCSREGGDVWEATRYAYESFDGQIQETIFRFMCAGCGATAFFRTDGSPSAEYTHTSTIGFGSRPERIAGLWLHPGPLLWPGDDGGPTVFYVTRTKHRPHEPEHVAGVVGWHIGPRGGVRWAAGLGATKYGSVKMGADRDFNSRRAAVTWIATRLGPGGEDITEVTR